MRRVQNHRQSKIAGLRPMRGTAVLAVVVGSTLLGTGVFASWTPSGTLVTGSSAAAMVGVTTADANGTTFSTAVPNLLPGDYFNRYVDLTNTGGVPETFTSAVSASGGLSSALSVAVDSCNVAWAPNGTCGGTTTTLTSATSAVSATTTLGSMAPAALNHLRYQFKLDPNAAQATYQGTSSTLQVAITGNTTVAGGRDRTIG